MTRLPVNVDWARYVAFIAHDHGARALAARAGMSRVAIEHYLCGWVSDVFFNNGVALLREASNLTPMQRWETLGTESLPDLPDGPVNWKHVASEVRSTFERKEVRKILTRDEYRCYRLAANSREGGSRQVMWTTGATVFGIAMDRLSQEQYRELLQGQAGIIAA